MCTKTSNRPYGESASRPIKSQIDSFDYMDTQSIDQSNYQSKYIKKCNSVRISRFVVCFEGLRSPKNSDAQSDTVENL